MFSTFEEANLYLYQAARGCMYDAVIWCLGPLVDDSREYGLPRLYLAAATRSVCRQVLRLPPN